MSMAKYAFFNFPSAGQLNPTLAIVQELVARGDDVVYFNLESCRSLIEAAGAGFHPYQTPLFQQDRPRGKSAMEDNRRLARLPVRLLQTSRQMIPLLLEGVMAEHPDGIVYSDMFLWARMIAHALGIAGVSLRPTYAPGARFRESMRQAAGLTYPRPPGWIADEMAYLRDTYRLPFPDLASLIKGDEGLRIVFLPRAFQPHGDTFDNRFLFVGPSFHPPPDHRLPFPLNRLGAGPRLYISLGTIFNDQARFYKQCIDAFGHSRWQVILSLGHRIDPESLDPVPDNFITAPHVPQLAVLAQTDLFISHGGMNSTMESLYFGVPLIVVPHIEEQKWTAQRIQQLGLGLAIDETAATAETLHEAVSRISRQPGFKKRVLEMQTHVRGAGGYRKAADAIQDYFRTQANQP